MSLGSCKQGRATGSYALPVPGRWIVQLLLGVPQFAPGAAAVPAAFPLEPDGKVFKDIIMLTINGQTKRLERKLDSSEAIKV